MDADRFRASPDPARALKRSIRRVVLYTVLALLLSGCQVELFSTLTERQGNQVLAVLLNHGINANKVQGKGNEVKIRVAKADVAAAVDLLDRYGLPQDQFQSLGTVFQDKSLVSSPMVERIRYSYGLSQALSETLTQIDGVLTARVLVVLPEPSSAGQKAEPASAAVFIRYRPDASIEDHVPRITQMVQNSVEGLAYENISVALFAADESLMTAPAKPPLTDILGIRIARDSLLPFVAVLGVLILGLLSAAAATLWLWRRNRNAGGKATAAPANSASGA